VPVCKENVCNKHVVSFRKNLPEKPNDGNKTFAGEDNVAPSAGMVFAIQKHSFESSVRENPMKFALPARIRLKVAIGICVMASTMLVATTSVGGAIPNLTIDWNDTHQNIDGYGASIPYIASQFVHFQQNGKVMDLLFDPNIGIGLLFYEAQSSNKVGAR